MAKIDIQAVYPRPRTSNTLTPDKQPKKYPFLLRGLVIKRPNQVWAADIT
jgi:putative transposase